MRTFASSAVSTLSASGNLLIRLIAARSAGVLSPNMYTFPRPCPRTTVLLALVTDGDDGDDGDDDCDDGSVELSVALRFGWRYKLSPGWKSIRYASSAVLPTFVQAEIAPHMIC